MHRYLSMLAMVAWLAAAISAQNVPPVEQIVKKAYHVAYYQGQDGKALVNMFIKDQLGNTRERRFQILRKNAGQGEQKYYVYFARPADVRRMVYMVWKHSARDDDRWLYLPALDLVKRIAASDKRSSFVGSHFVYEDVSGRNIADDHHQLVETNAKYFVLKNTPQDPSTVEFSYYMMWIHRQTYMPVKAVYYDKQGKRYRIIQALKLKIIDGFPTVVHSRAQDLRTGGETSMFFERVQYNAGIPADIFGEHYLRRPPRKWLR